MTCPECNDSGVAHYYESNFEMVPRFMGTPVLQIRDSQTVRRPCRRCTVSGDVACALAFDLGAQTERAAAFGPLLDALLATGGGASSLAYAIAKALGLTLAMGQFGGDLGRLLSDDALLAECKRRGFRRTGSGSL